jgi:hypothetical protein
MVLVSTSPFLQWIAGTVFLRIKRPEHKIDNFYIVPRLRMMGTVIPVHLWRGLGQLYTHEFEQLRHFRCFFFPLLPQEELSKAKYIYTGLHVLNLTCTQV